MSALPSAVLATAFSAFLPQDPPAVSPPPTQRYLVLLADRSFDLSSYRAAVSMRAPAGVASAVADDLLAKAVQDQAEITARIRDQYKGRILAQWWLVNGFAAELTPAQAAELGKHPRVRAVQADRITHPGRWIQTATNASNHASDLVKVLGIRGRGSVLAVVDSGVDSNMNGTGRPHATFFPNGDPNNKTGPGLGGSRLLANVQVGKMQPDDLISHGTGVAGIAAGARWNQGSVADDGHAAEALIVSYSVADDASGGAYVATLVSAWQKVAADRLRYGITVAVCSYEGYFPVHAPDQVAIDELARNGDVMVCGMGGNTAASAEYAYGATNMLAVGAVYANNRVVAEFSTRGPLLLTNRVYPDLVANGVAMRLPLADNEAGDKAGTGTSYSAPQVAGAALLYRSLRPGASAVETKAAILATSEDVAGKNPSAPYNTPNAYGHGYLRIDRLVALATGQGMLQTAAVTTAVPSRNFKFAVVEGQRYGVCLSWFRNVLTQSTWSNLDLVVRSGSQVLATSTRLENLSELVRFRAPVTGFVDIDVLAKSFEAGQASQAFALAAVESLPYWVQPQVTSFDRGCSSASFPQIPSLLLVSGEPRIGTTYQLGLAQTRPLLPVVLVTGASREQWGSIPLPFDMTPLGAPNCRVLTSFELLLGATTNPFGQATFFLSVPNHAALLDVSVFHQGYVLDPTFNALGVLVSGGLAARIGGG